MNNLLNYVIRLFVLLIVIVLGAIQDLGGFCLIAFNDSGGDIDLILFFSYFLAFFLPFWGIAFLNNNRKLEELDKFEKGFVYVSVCATIIFWYKCS